ncbi:Cleft lip and palate transmembrane protein 1-like protein [Stylophora pistillata]|uniref:Lipid scramblase CLPTM1L n=3 Tax=Stylophora pistillata TaxID=50429 RepID=A0A2B4S8Q4_STYPI|nr:Cleft lip and palate transmembrane protein 1-like protein [Stylophora pistillata]
MSFVTTVVLILFGLYIANSFYVIYHLFHIPSCQGGSRKCLQPHGIIDKELEISIYTSLEENIQNINKRNSNFLWKSDNFSVSNQFTVSINASIPNETRNNGSLYAHIFVYQVGASPFKSE